MKKSRFSEEQIAYALRMADGCPRRSKSEPPCRLNIEPGVGADFCGVGCG